MTSRSDLVSQEFFRNPAAVVERLRACGPVVEIRLPIVGKVWATTTYELAARVLKDSETFTMRNGGTIAGVRWWMPGIVRTLAESMLSMDEPDHTRLRGIVDEAFRRRAILELEPRILAIADELAGKLFADGSPVDLVDRYARKLPLSVICELLGLPLADRPKFIAWANRVARLTGPVSFLRMIVGLPAMKRYLEGRLQAARDHGGEGLIAELVRIEKEGGRINAREMVAMVFLLLGAGSETTTHLISGSVYELLKTPALRHCSRPTGAGPVWRSRNSCGSSRPCSFPSRASYERTSSSAASGSRRARESWPWSLQPTWTRMRTSGRSGSICRGGRTGISHLGPGSISAWVISLRASKARARFKLCSGVGRRSRWPWTRRRSAGGAGPACGRSKSSRSWQVRNDRLWMRHPGAGLRRGLAREKDD
jgi:hypothetical protein